MDALVAGTKHEPHRSGRFMGLCTPDLGTARRLSTKGCISDSLVSGTSMKSPPLRGSMSGLDAAGRCHSPFTAAEVLCVRPLLLLLHSQDGLFAKGSLKPAVQAGSSLVRDHSTHERAQIRPYAGKCDTSTPA